MKNNILFICGAAILITLLLTYLKHRGIKLSSFFKTAEEDIKEVENYTEIAIELSTGKVKSLLVPIKKLEELALIAVTAVEDMYLNGEFKDDGSGEQRRQAAINFVLKLLGEKNIKVTDELKAKIECIIRKEYFSSKTIGQLNSKVDDLIDKKVAVLQKEKEEIQAKLNFTVNELTTAKSQIITLQNKFATVQNIFNPTQNVATVVKSTTDANNAIAQPVENNIQ